MKPLKSWRGCAALAILAAAVPAFAAEEFRWEQDLATAQQLARQTNRLVLIHFGGPWCPPCQALERNVFSQPGFGRELTADYVGVKIDPNSSPEARAIAVKYGVQRVPTDVVTTPDGQLVAKMLSPNNAPDYTSTLANVARQVLPERGPPPAEPSTPASPPPAIAGQGGRGGQLAQRPAEDRYADYYSRQQAVEREPYQPPVRNQPPQAQSQSPGATAAADRYRDRYASQRQNSIANSSPPGAEDRYATESRYAADDRYAASQDRYATPPANSNLDNRTGAADQAQANADARYGAAQEAQGQDIARSQPQRGQSPGEQAGDGTVGQAQFADETQALEAKLPPGSPPLALDGFCAVSLFENRDEWQRGDPKWGAIHRGQTYLFASQEAQQKFLANPDFYCPVCRGHDPVLALDQNQAVPGRRQFGVFYNDRVYLFANEATLDQFSQNPKRYSAEILQAMRNTAPAK